MGWLELADSGAESPYRDIAVVAIGANADRLVGRAREMADALGCYVRAWALHDAPADALFAAGADEVVRLADTGAVARAFDAERPEFVLLPSEPRLVASVARTAQRLKAAMACADAVALDADSRSLRWTAPACGGRMSVELASDARPQIAALDPAALPEPIRRTGRAGADRALT